MLRYDIKFRKFYGQRGDVDDTVDDWLAKLTTKMRAPTKNERHFLQTYNVNKVQTEITDYFK